MEEKICVNKLFSLATCDCAQIIDSIVASRDEFGPWSLDFLRRNHGSFSWQIDGLDNSVQSNGTAEDVITLPLLYLTSRLRNWRMHDCRV